ncbi:ankyrin repeat domain-containing protein [Methanosarcina sp. 2.H.A.1B.4]|uniref:ankyrin repeat domain-containing protein n=1 Tax=Methanosarcina sp. 2.H.A.1B.4 TaxID=1483600 RepID=UPI001F2136A4|nr:ankyrin repeat domain-containing protein [Methanosarcina sp. 2.H.A.1B.4]
MNFSSCFLSRDIMGLFDKLRGAKRNPNSVDEFVEFVNACASGQIEDVGRILKENKNVIEIQDKNGITALMVAGDHGHRDVVELLIKAGAYPNIQNKNGNTTLNIAAAQGYKEIVELLIKSGANLNIQDTKGSTALMFAATGGHKDVVELLIKSGANLNIQDTKGSTALTYAVIEGIIDIVDLLIKGGANPNIQNKNGSTALIYAAKMGQKDIVELLIIGDANLNIQDTESRTALMSATVSAQKDIVELLIKAGTDLNIQDTDGSTALMFAVAKGDKDIVELFIKAGVDLNIQNKNSYTALIIATAKENKDIIELFPKNNKTEAFRADTKDNIIDCHYIEAKRMADEEARKAAEERGEQKREARKQKAMDIFFDFQKELRNSIYGEGTLAKIRSVMYQMSNFTTDRLDLTDADLEKAQTILEDIKTNWKKVEMECFVELESETKENEDGRKELCKITQGTCENFEEVELRKTKTRSVMEEYYEDGKESEYLKKRELIQSFAKNNYEKLSETTKNTCNALRVEMNKEEVKNAIDTVGKVINIVLTEENTVKKLKEEKIIGKKMAFTLKLITPIVEKKLIVLKPITPTIKKSLRDKMK